LLTSSPVRTPRCVRSGKKSRYIRTLATRRLDWEGIIRRIFELLPLSVDDADAGRDDSGAPLRYCVDVGAWDGRHLSNTNSLLAPSPHTALLPRWRGVLIEADGLRHRSLLALHAPPHVCLHAKVTCVPSSSLPSLLCSAASLLNRPESSPLPRRFDLLTVDVDGVDYWIVRDLLAADWRPRLVVVEFNPTLPHDLVYVPPRSDLDGDRHGASLAALLEMARGFGYRLVECTLYNAFFVHQSEADYVVGDQGVPERMVDDLEALRPPADRPMETSLYQLYNGSVGLWGCKRALWHGRGKFDEKALQAVLPGSAVGSRRKGKKGSKKGDGGKVGKTFPYAPQNLPDIVDSAEANESSP